LSVQVIFGLDDYYNWDATIMIQPTNHTGITSNPDRYTPTQIIPAERSAFDDRKVMSQTSSKYILDGNKIVFERYDRNGKLISRVPWTANRVSAEA
jgi:hypothetical protein